MNSKPANPEDVSVHSILSSIKDGKLDPSSLSKDVRQLCVEAMALEGHMPSSLAAILKVSDKTIRRDLKDIYERNSIRPSAELAMHLVGDFLLKTRAHHSHLMRLSRLREASVQEKVYAESAAAQVLKEMVKTLQSLGYLPSRPQEIVADLFHHTDSDDGLEGIKKQISEMEHIAQETGSLSPEVQAKLSALKLRIEQAEIKNELQNLTKTKEGQDEQATK